MALVEVENVTLRFGNKVVVQNVDWSVNEGENWAFLGLNGCGKTSLLSMLAGYTGPVSGNIKLFDTVVTQENRRELRRNISFVSSSFFNKIFRNEQVLDIILSGITEDFFINRDVVRVKDVNKARSLLAIYNLQDYLRYSYAQLSRGQQQCVLVARALMKKSKLLILDEPCEGLDLLKRDLLLQQINELIDENIGTIYVTHHTEELTSIFNKAIFMRDGKIHSQGNFETMFEKKNLEDFFKQKVKKMCCAEKLLLQFDWNDILFQ